MLLARTNAVGDVQTTVDCQKSINSVRAEEKAMEEKTWKRCESSNENGRDVRRTGLTLGTGDDNGVCSNYPNDRELKGRKLVPQVRC